MGWRDLIATGEETLVAPWLGGRSLRNEERRWGIRGPLPAEYGWCTFRLQGREAHLAGTSAEPQQLQHQLRGYLVGDRIIPDTFKWLPATSKQLLDGAERVHLIEPGLDRFARALVGRSYEDGPLVYLGPEMPLGAEEEVQKVFDDCGEKLPAMLVVKGAQPALYLALELEVHHRVEAARRRAALEQKRREEEERLQKEERRRQLAERLGDGAGRREMAAVDFGEAARAALTVGGAEYLDHRGGARRNEAVVRFRFERRRWECVCDTHSLRIIDSGICLTAHYDDPDFEGGTKGDNFFTLESLPSVIREAEREGKLVIYRHVDD